MTARLIALGLLVAVVPAARADVKPHPLFSDHMVLQRGGPVPVWGTAAAGEKVTVALAGPANAEAEAVADSDGKWLAKLPELKPGVGFTLTIKGMNTVELKDVLVGDVWLCSGQSNMEWLLANLPKDDQGKKVAAAAANPRLRFFDVPNVPSATPQSTVTVGGKSGKWLECTPQTAINFSAVGYFFGRDIEKTQDVPVGLVTADWGGTPAEAWTSKEGLAAESGLKQYLDRADTAVKMATDPAATKKYEADLAKWKEAADKAKAEKKPAPRQPQKPGINQNTPTVLYNGMIAPLKPFAFKGAIWYQGESNASAAKTYRTLFPAMIKDWRQQWGAELPFFAVQLAPFGNGKNNSGGAQYAELRDAQLYATKALPKVGIAVITDSGDETDIHPQRKEPVGARLALAARAIAYGESIVYAGPQYKSATAEGDKLVLSFDSVGDGLVAKDGELAGFTVCGEDKVFHPAKAEIKGDVVVLTSDKVPAPKHARFGWVNFAKPGLNFFNKAGLPASPFRTDDFPLTTN